MGVQTDRELPGEADLEIIFSIRHLRKVGEDNTIRYQGRIYQVLLSNSIREFGEKFLKKEESDISK